MNAVNWHKGNTRVDIIGWELCERLKCDHADKWYMHKPESVLENESHKISRILRYKQITQSQSED